MAGNLLTALVVAVLMAPLFYGSLALLLDGINLIVPAPNLVPGIGRALDQALNQPHSMTAADWLRLAATAALPGLIWMAFVLRALRRVLRICMTFDSGDLTTRPPDTTVLAEQRFANVITEMAVAASITAPRVFIADSGAAEATAFGIDEQHADVIVTKGLLDRLDRAQMEGVAAQLIASIADGDMKIGVRAALSVNLFALIARLGTLVTNKRNVRRNLRQLLRVALLPTVTSARKFITELASPFADDPGDAAGATPAVAMTPAVGLRARWEKIRTYLWLPLAGPLVMSGFFGAIVNLFILGPLLSLTWRQRKYMADATAVRLTRDPDTLARALEIMATAQSAPLVPWAAHMSVVSQRISTGGLFGGSAIAMFPSVDRRLRALGSMGAHVARPRRQMPFMLLLIIVPLVAILGVLVAIMLPLLIWLSLAATALFSGVPFAILHALLRWMGHH
jgi:Zn-dependent protease with chaperone function